MLRVRLRLSLDLSDSTAGVALVGCHIVEEIVGVDPEQKQGWENEEKAESEVEDG